MLLKGEVNMRTSKFDNNSFAPYKKTPEVEAVTSQLIVNYWEAKLNKALEEKMFATNPDDFQKLADSYLGAKKDLEKILKSLDKR
jgi:hypothetical protein